MKIKPRYGTFWIRKRRAMTLWPFVFFGSDIEDVSNPLKIHESIHWNEQDKWKVFWPFTWGVVYVVLAILHRTIGPKHPMENYAYIAQHSYQHANVATQRQYLQNNNWPIHKEEYGIQ